MESTRTCAPRIYVENAITLVACGFVRMTADNDFKSGCFWIQVQSVHIVEHINVRGSSFHYGCFWQRFRPFGSVNISTDRYYWSDLAERIQDVRIANIASVNDEIRAG